MSRKPSRRQLLKRTGAATLFGVVGTATPTKAKQTFTPAELDEADHSLPYDLRVDNNRDEPIVAIVTVYQTDDEDGSVVNASMFTREFTLEALTDEKNAESTNLDLSEGLYLLEVRTSDGQTSELPFGVPPGGIPDWYGLTIRILPNDDIIPSEVKI